MMKYLPLVLFFDALFKAEFAKSVNDSNARIGEGHDAVDGQFPFVVYLLFFPDGDSYAICSGSLVAYNFVLTAAHCVADMALSDTYIMAGIANAERYFLFRQDSFIKQEITPYHSSTSQESKAAEFLIHPYYSEDTSFDIALIRLKKKFKENKFVKTINVILDDITLTMKCNIMGYGKTYLLANSQLRFIVASGIQNSTVLCGLENFVINYYCLNQRSEKSCAGDSGGPVICNGRVYAINSASTDLISEDTECRAPSISFFSKIAQAERKIKFLSKYIDLEIPRASSPICSTVALQWQIFLFGLNVFFS